MLTEKNFICKQCGRCCLTYTVKLSGSDIKKIENLGIKKDEFAEKDEFDITYGKYSLKRNEKGCIFLAKKAEKYFCKIYQARPEICRKYPFNESSEIVGCEPAKNNFKS